MGKLDQFIELSLIRWYVINQQKFCVSSLWLRDLQEKSDHEVVNISHSGSSDAAERNHVEQQNKMAAARNQNKMTSIVEEQSKIIFSSHSNFSLKGD